MAKQILTRGARIAHCVTQQDESGAFVRINARADYTDSLRDEMGWPDMHLKAKNMELEGELTKGALVLASQQLATSGSAPELRINYDSMRTFRAVRVKEKDQESTRVEIRFHIISRDANAAKLCFDYKADAKKSLGSLQIAIGASTAGKPTEAPPPLLAQSGEVIDGQTEVPISIAEGMKIVSDKPNGNGKRQVRRGGALAAAAASEVSVQLEPGERERLEAIISQSVEAGQSEPLH